MYEEELRLESIQGKETELQSLVIMSNKQELAQCVRLLSIYLAIYKKDFGDLPPTSFEKLMDAESIDIHCAAIFENGISEAIAMLNLVLQSQTSEAVNAQKISIN